MAKRKKTPEDMTVDELHAEASARDIPGRSSMNREELLAALAEPKAEADDGAEPEVVPPASVAHPPSGEVRSGAPGAPLTVPVPASEPLPVAAPEPVSLPVPDPIPSGPPPVSAAPGVPLAPLKPPAPKPGMRKARVSIPGTHVGDIDVEIPAALTGSEANAAAIQAAKDKRGITQFGAGPVVELL